MGLSDLFVNRAKVSRTRVMERSTRHPYVHAKASGAQLTGGAMTVGKLLSRVHPLPSHLILLGQCHDGLPFLIGMDDPALGAVLIACDQGCGKTHHLQVMVDSALRVSKPHDIQVSILTLNPNEWDDVQNDLRRSKYIHAVHAWYDHRAEQTIQELINLAEERREGQTGGPAILLILDDLNYVEELSYAAQVNLHWLLAYGAQSDVWIVGSINADLVPSFRFWIDTFRTRIIGRSSHQEDAEILAMRADSTASHITPAEFCVWMGQGWSTYRLPVLGD